MSIFRLIEKIAALLFVIGYVIAMFVSRQWTVPQAAFCVLGLMLPLACIWFPEELGSYTGIYVGRGETLDTETPPALVSIMGRVILVGLPAIAYFRLLG